VFVSDSFPFSGSLKFNPSASAFASVFVNESDDSTGENRIGLIVGIVSSLMIGIICLIVFLIVRKIHKQKEKSVDILYQDLPLDDGDDYHTSIITVTATCALSDDTLATGVLSVTHPSDFYDQSTLDPA
jgi:ABC-type transport system involved in multi-copper enzyme maturation permease subunit